MGTWGKKKMAIKDLGNGKYFVRVTVYIRGKKRERKCTAKFPTKGSAKAKEKELLRLLNEIKEREENEMLYYTWERAKDDYLSFSEENHRLSTYYNRSKVLNAHTKIFNKREIKEITREEIKSLVNELPFTISYKIEVLKYVRQVLELALENGKINYNPAKKIKIMGDKSNLEKANKLEAMTKNEINMLLSYTKEIGHEYHSIFYVSYQTGMRSGEAMAFEFEDIDWDRNHISIAKSWCKQSGALVPPKNGTSRIVPMNDQFKIFLKELGLQSNYKGFVLPRINSWFGGRATKILQELQRHLGIKETNFHSIRASFITHLLRNGMDIIRVQAMVGHKDLKTTQKYIRLDATDLVGATNSLEVDMEERGQVIDLEKRHSKK